MEQRSFLMSESVKARAKKPAKRAASPRSGRQAKQGFKFAAIGVGALAIARAAFSVAKFLGAVGLLAATAVGAAALMPKHLRKQVASDVKRIATLTTNEVAAQARALGV